MQDYFYHLMSQLDTQLHRDEIYLCRFQAEHSDFIRFNHAKVRQATSVNQAGLELDLIQGQRHVTGDTTLIGDATTDLARLTQLLQQLRERLAYMPADPYLLYATEIHSSAESNANQLPDTDAVLDEIITATQAYDFVGIYAAGGMYTGFANSLGQRNWHSSYNFNLDWSLYHAQDKAVKSLYAGFTWDSDTFQSKIQHATEQLALLKQPPKTVTPGQYRVYLAPAALYEILSLLCWGGFSAKEQQTKSSALLKMLEDPPNTLHPSITLHENTAEGIAPAFQAEGFIKPATVTLIKHGSYQDPLVSPRSAQEYDLPTNAANAMESPLSLDLTAGDFAQAEVLSTLETGIYVNNLWYLNYSDRSACRITGMTRFATFWVENGHIIAPLNVMRFDETLYQLLGNSLIALTQERDFIIDSSTYEHRSVASMRLPGALVDAMTFTL